MFFRIILVLSVVLALTIVSEANQTIIAYGDSRTNASQHLQVLTAFAKMNPNLVLHTGDLWDGYPQAIWQEHITRNPVTKKLNDDSLYLIARGNHETEAAVLALRPAMVRNNSIKYSFVRDNCFFLCLGYEPSSSNLTYARQQLTSTAAKTADWRIVFFHVPIYSSGEHGGSQNSTFIGLCDSFKVNAVFSGHDHIYERSYLMYKNLPRSTSKTITDSLGTLYIVIGVGGAPFYTVTGGTWTGFKLANTLAFCAIKTTPTSLRIETRKTDTTLIEAITWTKPSTGVAPRVAQEVSQTAGMTAQFSASSKMVTLSNVPFTGNLIVEIYALDGKKVSTSAITATGLSAQVSIGNVASGAHAVCVRKGEAWLWTPLVVK